MTLFTDTLALVAATDAHEGPVYVAEEGALSFTSLPLGSGVAAQLGARALGQRPRSWPAVAAAQVHDSA
jgi:hypothetical protein